MKSLLARARPFVPAFVLALVPAFASVAGCGGKVPETRYYQLASPTAPTRTGEAILVLESLSTDAAYDDERIVYRTTPYRLDYYQYHRWSASPGVMVGNYLERALEKSGRFRTVVREVTDQAPVTLSGRVVAIEEVDVSKGRWIGRIVLELTLAEAKTGKVLWSEQFEETEPLANQDPEGLAHALSKIMGRIATRAAPTIADHADHQARLNAETPDVARLPAR
ncbi:MAG: membrane integrity-associated transporter subunit PqiC [Deltaproteobacteria bacterium]|nr:membrane integrity-associated transporter subunit PqiC [Deltaproteobacteria bacterium]